MTADDVYKQQSFGARVGFGHSMGLLIIDFWCAALPIPEHSAASTSLQGRSGARRNCSPRRVPLPCLSLTPACAQEGGTQSRVRSVSRFRNLAKLTADAAESHRRRAESGQGRVHRHQTARLRIFRHDVVLMAADTAVDTLLIAGCITSGCVRASVIDASAHGLRPIVVEECVGDRAEATRIAPICSTWIRSTRTWSRWPRC